MSKLFKIHDLNLDIKGRSLRCYDFLQIILWSGILYIDKKETSATNETVLKRMRKEK